MDISKTTWMNVPQVIQRKADAPLAVERLCYLWPSRYFHLYMFYERESHRTCWLPEGYLQ